MYDNIIPLGHNCNITFLLLHTNIKKETSLFEWFATENFTDVIDIIDKFSKIYNEIEKHDINIIPRNNEKGVIIEKDSICSIHYKKSNYREILNRRCKRFFENIKNSKSLLFIRMKNGNIIKSEDINRLKKIVADINPVLEKVNFLLIDDEKKVNSNYNDDLKKDNFVIFRYIDIGEKSFKEYEKRISGINKFAEIMNEFGYPINISKYTK
jgi:hypothetical protein